MKIALLGFYNKMNFGDDLMSEVLPQVLSRPNLDTCQAFSDANGKFAINGLVEPTYLQYDVIVIGGGGIIAPDFWAFANGGIESLALSQKPIAFVNVNVVSDYLESSDFVAKLRSLNARWWVRDQESVEMLNRCGIKAQMVPDISFRPGVINVVNADRPKRVSVFLNSYVLNNAFSHTSVSDYLHANEVMRTIASHLDWLMYFGYQITLYPAQVSKDIDDRIPSAITFALTKDKGKCQWISEPLNWRQLVQAISESRIVISMRFHSSAIALAAGVPVVDIIHHPKNDRLVKATHLQEASVSYDLLTNESLIKATQAAERLIPNSQEVQSYLAEGRQRWEAFDQQWTAYLNSIQHSNGTSTSG
jgi:polysaccharide pyruvyl transferase WcaK-like protein